MFYHTGISLKSDTVQVAHTPMSRKIKSSSGTTSLPLGLKLKTDDHKVLPVRVVRPTATTHRKPNTNGHRAWAYRAGPTSVCKQRARHIVMTTIALDAVAMAKSPVFVTIFTTVEVEGFSSFGTSFFLLLKGCDTFSATTSIAERTAS
ncbi:hypothetical protein Mapa_015851 [Marchantia paleacea]|nr:hypothetical protein Mapa_015851 [Marchantia paleacea]